MKMSVTDIASLALEELTQDRAASVADIAVCRRALACGVTHHKDGLAVEERIRVNSEIIQAIDAELIRRKAAP